VTNIDSAVLQKHWRHAHEEDSDAEMIFRPASYAFGPSRGRAGFDLRPDGSYAESAPGPADAPNETEGTWELRGDELKLRAGDGSTRVLQIASAEPDRLVIKK
jgi:hypothetical protein